MQRHRFVLAISSAFTVPAGLWCLGAVAVTNHFAARALPLEGPAAAATTVLAGVFALSLMFRKRTDDDRERDRQEFRRREAVVIRTASYAALARTSGPIPTPPYPVRRLYPVREAASRREPRPSAG